jgi:hypothetical protein
MSAANLWIPKFNAGELSPLLFGFSNWEKYGYGLRTAENVICLPQGPLTRRPGTIHRGAVKDSSKRTGLIPFEYSTEQAYWLEIGDRYMRFITRDGAYLRAGPTDAAITNGTFETNITGWTDSSTGGASIAHDAINDVMNLVGAAGGVAIARQTVTGFTISTTVVLQIRVFESALATYPGPFIKLRVGSTSGGTELINDRVLYAGDHLVEIFATATTLYLELRNDLGALTMAVDDIRLLDDEVLDLPHPLAAGAMFDSSGRLRLHWTQSADVLWITYVGWWTRRLERRGALTWSFFTDPVEDGPYLETNITTTTLVASGAGLGPGITVTASATAGINDGQGFTIGDIGRAIGIKNGSTWGWCRITARTSATAVTVIVYKSLPTSGAVDWRLGLYDNFTGFHPRAITLHQDRLVIGGSVRRPNRVDGSAVGDYVSFAPGTADDDAFAYALGGNSVPSVLWLASLQNLLVGTLGGEYMLSADGPNKPLTPVNAAAARQSAFGTVPLPPILSHYAVLFAQRHGGRLRELAYTIEAEGYRAPDLTVAASHIFPPTAPIVAFCWQSAPHSLVWLARQDGLLVSCTYDREQQVIAWTRHPMGGAVVEQVQAIPGSGSDQVMMIVRRTINGVTVRHVEQLAGFFADDGADQRDAFFVDDGLTLDNPVTVTSITAANPAVVTAASHGFSDGDLVELDEVVGMTAVNLRRFTVANAATNTFELTGFDATGLTAGSGGVVRECVTAVAGLSHLEGETVSIWADGQQQPAKVVSGGQITGLDPPVAIAQVGLPIGFAVSPLRPQGGARLGTQNARAQRIGELALDLYRTGGKVEIGTTDTGDFWALPLRDWSAATDRAPALYSGLVTWTPGGGYDREGAILVRGATPAPFTLRGLGPAVEVGER